MTEEEKKDMAARLLHASASGDAETVRAVINPDFTFRFMQKAESWSSDGKEVSATLDRDAYLENGVTVCKQITRDGMHFTIELIVLDGDWMAVFGHSNATSLKGKPYNNNYCWRLRFSGNGVSELREYCDTKHAYDVLFEE
ncbi:MAG: nuclear transport factor 2 family protein [Novosphingobium sp.]